MKNGILFLGLVAFMALAFTNPVTVDTLKVDTTKSKVVWKGYKVLGSHYGTIDIKEGDLEYTDGKLSGGKFVIDMATLKSDDLEGNMKAKLEGHLKSDDFFGVEKYPTATFEITQVISRGKPGEYKILGDLTIKETTKEIKFNAVVEENDNGEMVATTAIQIDRSEYDIRYGSGTFFENLGDKTIYDEFDLEISLVAAK